MEDAETPEVGVVLAALISAAYRVTLRLSRAKVRELGWYEFEEVLAHAAGPEAAAANLADARRLGAALFGRALGSPLPYADSPV